MGRKIESKFVAYAKTVLDEDMNEDDKETLELLYDLWKTAQGQ